MHPDDRFWIYGNCHDGRGFLDGLPRRAVNHAANPATTLVSLPETAIGRGISCLGLVFVSSRRR